MQEDRHLAIWWCWCPKEQCYAAGGYVGGGASFVGDTLFELQEKLENSLAVLGYPRSTRKLAERAASPSCNRSGIPLEIDKCSF